MSDGFSHVGLPVNPYAQGNLDGGRKNAVQGLMKVATFNINNINKRLDPLLAVVLAKAEPDVVSLQGAQGKSREPFP